MSHSFEEQNLLGLRLLLENSANATKDSLQNFANLPGFDEQMILAFGNNFDIDLLQTNWRSHNFTFPNIEVVSNNTINGSNGAFSIDTNTIYLSAEFLTANQSNLDVVNSVLLEEYGHYLDNKFNSVDSPGDEGAIFSAIVRGEKLTDSDLQQLRNEDDSAVVNIDGESVAIEQNELIVESLFDATIFRVFEEVPIRSGNYVDRGEEIFFGEAAVIGSNWWNLLFSREKIEQVGIVEFLLPDPETITPNTEIILRLHDTGDKSSDNPRDFSENPTVTDNSIIVSGYIGDGEATVSDRDISATQITTITTDAEKRGSSGNFPDDDPYLVDVTNFVVNAINSGEEIVGFRFNTNSASTFEAFVGPGFDDPIGLVFQESANQPPVANPDTTDSNGNPLTVNVGESILIDVLANDSDPDPNDTLNISSLDGSPFFGDATIVTINGRQQIEYTPNLDTLSAGSRLPSQRENFGYIVTDGTDTARVGTPGVLIEINQLYAEDDSISSLGLEPDDSVSINVLDNDEDPEGESFSIDSVDNPVFGTAQIVNNQIVYTPNNNFTGADSFEYTIRDARGATNTATINISPEPIVTFESLVIDGAEGTTQTVTLKRSGDLNLETTVELNFIPLDLVNQNASSAFSRFVNSAEAINTITTGIKDGITDILGSITGFPSDLVPSTASKVFSLVSKVIVPLDILQSGIAQAQANANDIQLSQTSITFDPGQDTQTVSLEYVQDNEPEGDQIFYLELSSLQNPQALGVIRDDDKVLPGINFNDPNDVLDLTVNAIAGGIVGAISGGVTGGIVGGVAGGVAGGVFAGLLTELAEILEDSWQQSIVDRQVSGFNSINTNNINTNSVSFNTLNTSNIDANGINETSYDLNFGSQESDTLNANAGGAEIRGFAGDDIINGNIGNDILSGGEDEDVITGGEGFDLIEGGLGADTLSGNQGADIFAGNLAELDGDVISDFTSEDVIAIDDVSFSADSLTVTQGSAILDIDTDLDGAIDSTVTLEGDFTNTNFDVETASLGEFTTTFISINNSEPANIIEGSSTVYRFFNPSAGVHFYTASEVERDVVLDLPNYSFEGESYNTVDPLSGGAEDVYRFFNTNTGVHLYTTDENERDFIIENLAEFAFEETAFSAYETEIEGAIPIHRFYEPSIGVHFYTPNETERMFVEDNLSNYTYEGIAYYAFPLDRIV